MTPADQAAALVITAVICVVTLGVCGLTAYVEASPRRRALVDRIGTWIFDR